MRINADTGGQDMYLSTCNIYNQCETEVQARGRRSNQRVRQKVNRLKSSGTGWSNYNKTVWR